MKKIKLLILIAILFVVTYSAYHWIQIKKEESMIPKEYTVISEFTEAKTHIKYFNFLSQISLLERKNIYMIDREKNIIAFHSSEGSTKVIKIEQKNDIMNIHLDAFLDIDPTTLESSFAIHSKKPLPNKINIIGEEYDKKIAFEEIPYKEFQNYVKKQTIKK